MSRLKTTFSLGVLTLLAIFGMAKQASAVTSASIYVNGTLTALSGNILPATLTLTSGASTYIVNVPANVNIDRKLNGESNLGEFILGDTLQVWGKLSDVSTNTIDATRIRDVSIQRAGGTFKGAILELDCANNKFTYKPDGRAQQTVYILSTTKIIRGGEKIACKDLAVNEKAKVIGLWRQSSKRIDADRIIVDMRTISGTISAITLTNNGLPATLTTQLKNGQTWTVNVDATTTLYRKYLGKATIEEILVGDKIEARGMAMVGNLLLAKTVRDTSISIKYSDYKGTVKTIDATAQTFVLRVNSKKNGDITVTTSSSTKYYDGTTAKAFADIAVGDKLKILGTYTSATKILAATRIFWRE
jgi:hypothetical protein